MVTAVYPERGREAGERRLAGNLRGEEICIFILTARSFARVNVWAEKGRGNGVGGGGGGGGGANIYWSEQQTQPFQLYIHTENLLLCSTYTTQLRTSVQFSSRWYL